MPHGKIQTGDEKRIDATMARLCSGASLVPALERKGMEKITLKAARVNKGLTQKDVAEIGKIGLSTIGAWERGQAEPDHLQLLGLASLYGVDVDDLLLPEVET